MILGFIRIILGAVLRRRRGWVNVVNREEDLEEIRVKVSGTWTRVVLLEILGSYWSLNNLKREPSGFLIIDKVRDNCNLVVFSSFFLMLS